MNQAQINMNEPIYTLPSQIPKLNMDFIRSRSPSPAAGGGGESNTKSYCSGSQASDSHPLHSVRSSAPYAEIEKNNSDTTNSSRNIHKDTLKEWNRVENLRTLFGWITISALNIECLNEAIIRYRKFIAYGTIMGLLFSTASGTISSTQFNSNNPRISFGLNILFTFFSFMIAIYTGILKTLQIQERLENFIKIKQEWILFSATISSELQLPIYLRTPILHIIKNYKNKFLDLLKTDLEIPEFIKNDIIRQIKLKEEKKYKNKKWDDLKYSESSSLADVIMEIGSQELKRLLTQYENAPKKSAAARKTSAAAAAAEAMHKQKINNFNSVSNYNIRRELDNIYRQFALINKNVDSMNSSIANKHKRKHIQLSPRDSEDGDIETGDSSENTAEKNMKRECKNLESFCNGTRKLSKHYSFLDLNNENLDFTNIKEQIKKLHEEQKKLNRILSFRETMDDGGGPVSNAAAAALAADSIKSPRQSGSGGVAENINSISDVYKNIMDGTIAQQILSSEENSEENSIQDYYMDDISKYENANQNYNYDEVKEEISVSSSVSSKF
jgi:hypothetical protein